MKTVVLVVLLLINNAFAQKCLIDGKSMFSIGSSEMVNGELLALFRCDDGHQMWLTNFEEENTPKNIDNETVGTPKSEPLIVSGTFSLLASALEPKISTEKSKDETLSYPISKKETVLKIGSSSANYTNDINIKKFGVETLLHKKIESDRVFAEEIEEEKNELLYIMNAQKRLFELSERSNIKFRPLKNSVKFSIYATLSAILFSSL